MRAPRWLLAWWQRRRVRLAMHQIAQFSPEFRRELGLDDLTIDDLVALEGGGDFDAARQAVLARRNAPTAGPCAPGATP